MNYYKIKLLSLLVVANCIASDSNNVITFKEKEYDQEMQKQYMQEALQGIKPEFHEQFAQQKTYQDRAEAAFKRDWGNRWYKGGVLAGLRIIATGEFTYDHNFMGVFYTNDLFKVNIDILPKKINNPNKMSYQEDTYEKNENTKNEFEQFHTFLNSKDMKPSRQAAAEILVKMKQPQSVRNLVVLTGLSAATYYALTRPDVSDAITTAVNSALPYVDASVKSLVTPENVLKTVKMGVAVTGLSALGLTGKRAANNVIFYHNEEAMQKFFETIYFPDYVKKENLQTLNARLTKPFGTLTTASTLLVSAAAAYKLAN